MNDHALKAPAPGWLTGKLSDLVGLYVFRSSWASAMNVPPRARDLS